MQLQKVKTTIHRSYYLALSMFIGLLSFSGGTQSSISSAPAQQTELILSNTEVSEKAPASLFAQKKTISPPLFRVCSIHGVSYQTWLSTSLCVVSIQDQPRQVNLIYSPRRSLDLPALG